MSKKQAIQELLARKSSTEIHKNRDTELQDYTSEVTNPTLKTARDQFNNEFPAVTVEKKKATFELSPELHTELKIFAAKKNKKMVEVVEAALKKYFDSQ